MLLGAWPGALLRVLLRGFAAEAPFWAVHDYYDPAKPFFSYLYNPVRISALRPVSGK